MDSFTQAYLECALWSSTDDDNEPLDKNYSVSDSHPHTIAKMQADCRKFQAENEIPARRRPTQRSDAEMAGHDFWLTRNGHGAGFWDGKWPEGDGERLTKASKAFGEFSFYVGDDGKIHGE